MSKTKAELEAGTGEIAVFLMDFDSDNNAFVPRFTFNDVKEAVIAGEVPFVRGSAASGNDFFFVLEPIMMLGRTSGTYQVMTANATFEASAPDVFLQNGGLS